MSLSLPPAAMPSDVPQRTPKKGCLRAWILLSESRKMMLVAVVSVIAFAVFRSTFFAVKPNEFNAGGHSLTASTYFGANFVGLAQRRSRA